VNFKAVLIILLVILFPSLVYAISINEIMYNPNQCSDIYCEWVELYNDEITAVDLSSWTIDDNNFEDITILPDEYIIIAKKLIDASGGESFEYYWGNNDGIWDSNDDSYRAVDGYFGFTNTDDTIILKNGNGDIVDSVAYSDSFGADGNGKTLEWSGSEWMESLNVNGTPGEENSIYAFERNFSAIMINEFMPNPLGADGASLPGGEWVELYNPTSANMNLEGLVLYDAYDDHELYIVDTSVLSTTVIQANDYLVVYRNGDSDFSLNNNLDEVRLYDGYPLSSSNLIDEVSYGDSTEGSSWSKIGTSWQQTIPSPGEDNLNYTDYVVHVVDGDTVDLANGERVRLIGIDTPEVGKYYYEEARDRLIELVEEKNVTLERDLEDRDIYNRLLRYIFIDDVFVNLVLVEEGFARAYPSSLTATYEEEFAEAEASARDAKLGIWEFSEDYSSLRINEFIPDPDGYDNAPMPDGEWVELYNSGNEPLNVKGLVLNDNLGDGLEISDVNVIGSTIINPNGFLVIYRNGNGKLVLNNEGSDMVVLSSDGVVIDSVDYSGSKSGNSYSYLEGFGWQNTMPTPGEANIYQSQHNESYVKIEKIYDLGSDKKAKFGQTIRVKVDIYKGDETKNTVKLWIEDISKQTKTNLYTKYTNYILTLPIQIKPNCNNEFDDGKYNIYIEGFGKSDKEQIQVEDILRGVCDTTLVDSASSKQKFEYNLLSYPETVYPGKEFTIKVEIKSDDKTHELEVWSYVYRGSKSYSGEREQNKQKVNLPAGSSIIIDLKNTVIETSPGDYKLKVKIKKDDLKTLKELTGELVVEEYPEETISAATFFSQKRAFNSGKTFAISTIMFESSQRKAEKLVPYAVALIMSATVIFFILSKKGIL